MTPALRDLAISEATRLGFHRVGIASVQPSPAFTAFRAWLDAGHHGSMSYLADPAQVEARGNLELVLHGAKSAVVVALAHAAPSPTAGRPLHDPERGPRGVIAGYARGDDYHMIMKPKLRALGHALVAASETPLATRDCVDTAPVFERDLAVRAGLGFIGKNTMLIVPGLGSYVMLGVLLVDRDLTVEHERGPGAPPSAADRCGSCRACLDACPTQAFAAPFVLNARRCISYLTIESREPLALDLRAALGNRIFGCDDCQTSCPYNGAAPARTAPADKLTPRDLEHTTPALVTLLRMSAGDRRRYLKRTALRRASRQTLSRNALVALGNAATQGDLAPEVAAAQSPAAEAPVIATMIAALADHSPLIREHAAWALGQHRQFAPLTAALQEEGDPAVRAAIERALDAQQRSPDLADATTCPAGAAQGEGGKVKT